MVDVLTPSWPASDFFASATSFDAPIYAYSKFAALRKSKYLLKALQAIILHTQTPTTTAINCFLSRNVWR